MAWQEPKSMTSRCGSPSVLGTFITCQTYWSLPSPPLLVPGSHGTLQTGGRRDARHSRVHWRGGRGAARGGEGSPPARGGAATRCLTPPGGQRAFRQAASPPCLLPVWAGSFCEQ